MNAVDAVRSGRIKPSHIRNFCMLAHVDHGKTTISDFLLSSNGVLSEALAGQVRFLDSRPDEQERLITMKASSVALHHQYNGEDYLCNLVDCPGHIDFSCEVSTALRVCDGGLVIVDIVDGATMQTHLMLRQGLMEGISMSLVINKLDVAIVTQGLSPEEVYMKVSEIVSSCNVALAAMVSNMQISEGVDALSGKKSTFRGAIPEDEVWFSPSKGNVLFCSAIDGWGFSLGHFAKLYAAKLPFDEPTLMDALWGDHFIVGKSITTKPKRDGQPPLFVTHVLQILCTLYETGLSEPFDGDKLDALGSKMGIQRNKWDRPGSRREPKVMLSQLMSSWMPLAKCLLDTVAQKLDSPQASNQRRLPSLLPSWTSIPRRLRDGMWNCDAAEDAPAVAFVAKLIDTQSIAGHTQYSDGVQVFVLEDSFVAFGRVYSGRLRKGQSVYVQSAGSKVELPITNVYCLQGQGLVEVDDMPAGCLFAARGLATSVTKSATISNEDLMPPFPPLSLMSSSIVKHTIQPKNPADMVKLLAALKILNQVDPQLELTVTPTGDYVICCAGEVHAERCVVDLNETFAPELDISMSAPIVTFRETIVAPSLRQKVVVNKTINGHFSVSMCALPLPEEALAVMSQDAENQMTPEFEAKVLHAMKNCEQKKKWEDLLQRGLWARGPSKFGYLGCLLINGIPHSDSASPLPSQAASAEDLTAQDEEGAVDAEDAASLRSDESAAAYTARLLRQYQDAIKSGFQIAAAAGPMAEEPLYGMAFVVTGLEFHQEGANTKGMNPDGEFTSAGTLSGQIIHAVSTCCRLAMQEHGRRLVEPVYHCTVQSSGATQGKIYATLSRRRADILDEVLHEGSDLFHIVCELPAVESFGLLTELRDSTHGAATAQLRMSHWSIVDADPYFKPTTKEEVEELGAKVATQNIGEALLEKVRRRKGLHRENIVDSEKQKFSIRGA